jgi:hypothetical protein
VIFSLKKQEGIDMTDAVDEITQVVTPEKKKKNSFGLFLLIIIIFVLVWIFVRPGVYTIQPIGMLPDGVTVIYYGRGAEMPFFSSPDGLCLQELGEVSLLCRMSAMAGSTELTERIILRLPYSHWAYLQSTGGLEFEK